MGMKLEQLASFEAVARLGNFTRAAEEQFLAQPSLSRQISTLESDLGQGLFERATSGVRLTQAGEALLPIARRMLADAEAARREMQALSGLERGRVRLGAPPTLCVSVVAEVLAEFREAHPGVALEVMEAGSHALAQALAQGQLDLALTIERGILDPSVESVQLFTEELVVASARSEGGPGSQHRAAPDAARSGERAASGNAGAGAPAVSSAVVQNGPRPGRGRAALLMGSDFDPPQARAVAVRAGASRAAVSGRITLAQLARLPQVAFNRSYDLRQATDAAFEAAGLRPTVAVEGAEMDAVLRFVERGLGVAVVPATILLDRPGLQAARLVRPALTRTAALSLRAGATPDAATRAMRALVFQVSARLTAPGAELAEFVVPA